MGDDGNNKLNAMSQAVLAISAELTVDAALQKMVDAARELVRAHYAALGIPDGEGGFDQFITSGVSDEQIAAIGPLPRTHGLLGAMLEDARPFRSDDIKRDAAVRRLAVDASGHDVVPWRADRLEGANHRCVLPHR